VISMRVRVIHSFFSGGRDSALASFIAYRVAKARGWGFRLGTLGAIANIATLTLLVHSLGIWAIAAANLTGNTTTLAILLTRLA